MNNILIRNSGNVSECMLIPGEDVLDLDLLKRVDVKNFVGERKVLSMEIWEPAVKGTLVVDLDFSTK